MLETIESLTEPTVILCKYCCCSKLILSFWVVSMAGGSQKNALKHAPPTPKYVLCAFICRDLNSAPNSSFVKTLRGQRNGAWRAAIHGVAKSRTRLSDFTSSSHFSKTAKGVPCPSSRAEGLLFLHGLESNPGSSLQTEEEAGLP